MKIKLIMGILFLSISSITKAQICPVSCDHLDLSSSNRNFVQRSAAVNIVPDTIFYLPLQPIVLIDPVTNEPVISEEKLVSDVVWANRQIAEHNLQYYLLEPQYVSGSNELLNIEFNLSRTDRLELIEGFLTPIGVNVFYVKDILLDGQAGFISGFSPVYSGPNVPLPELLNSLFIVGDEVKGARVINHEMGHFMSLFHTFETDNGIEKTDGSNCGTTGDFICDTPADLPRDSPFGQQIVLTNTENGFSHNGADFSDGCGTYANLPIENLMSVSRAEIVNEVFTDEQAERVFTALEDRIANTNADYILDELPELPLILESSLNENGILLEWNSQYDLGYQIERSESITGPFEIIGSTTENLFLDSDILSNTTFFYRIKSIRTQEMYSNTLEITSELVYCSPTYGAGVCQFSQIHGVSIDDIGFESVDRCDDENQGYNIYDDVIELDENSEVTIDLSFINPATGSFFGQFVTVWIDYNVDGTYSDEEIILQLNASSFETPISISNSRPSFTFNTPIIDGGDVLTRIRFSSESDGLIDMVSDPCGNYAFGETEEYNLLLLDNDVTAGINDSEDDGIKIYPNPAKDVVSIESSFGLRSLEFSDLQGQVIKGIEIEESSGVHQLKLQEVPSGVYILSLETESKKVVRRITVE